MARGPNPLICLGINIILERLGISGGQGQASANQEREIGDLSSIAALRHKAGSVTIILGRRESGKTVLAYRLAELLSRPIYAVSPEQAVPKGVIELDFSELEDSPPSRSTLILDDTPVYASQRDYNSPAVRIMEKLIPVVRHKRKLHLIFVSQSSALSDRYILTADIVFLKQPSLLFVETERPQVARFYRTVAPIFERMNEAQRKRHVYLISDDWRGLVRINMSGLSA